MKNIFQKPLDMSSPMQHFPSSALFHYPILSCHMVSHSVDSPWHPNNFKTYQATFDLHISTNFSIHNVPTLLDIGATLAPINTNVLNKSLKIIYEIEKVQKKITYDLEKS